MLTVQRMSVTTSHACPRPIVHCGIRGQPTSHAGDASTYVERAVRLLRHRCIREDDDRYRNAEPWNYTSLNAQAVYRSGDTYQERPGRIRSQLISPAMSAVSGCRADTRNTTCELSIRHEILAGYVDVCVLDHEHKDGGNSGLRRERAIELSTSCVDDTDPKRTMASQGKWRHFLQGI